MDYKMHKIKASENKSLPDINPNLDEFLRGLLFSGRGRIKLPSKTRQNYARNLKSGM